MVQKNQLAPDATNSPTKYRATKMTFSTQSFIYAYVKRQVRLYLLVTADHLHFVWSTVPTFSSGHTEKWQLLLTYLLCPEQAFSNQKGNEAMPSPKHTAYQCPWDTNKKKARTWHASGLASPLEFNWRMTFFVAQQTTLISQLPIACAF